MSNRADVHKFLKKLRKMHPYLEVEQRANGHYRIRNPNNGGEITCPYSPGYFRWIRYVERDCRVWLGIEV